MVPSKRGLNVLPGLPSLNQISYDFMIMKIAEDMETSNISSLTLLILACHGLSP